MPEADPSLTVEKALESARNVRLGRGVVSKTSYIAAAIVAVWGIIAWRWSDNLVMDAGLFLIGLLMTFFGVWFIRGTQKFAERNPAQAMLEGAELLEWRKMDVQAKGQLPVTNPLLVHDQAGPDLAIGQGK